jgi:hypothetical protein
MVEGKSDVTPSDEAAANYLVPYAVNLLCPEHIWQLRTQRRTTGRHPKRARTQTRQICPTAKPGAAVNRKTFIADVVKASPTARQNISETGAVQGMAASA